MATNPLPSTGDPVTDSRVARVLAGFDRKQLTGFITVAIELVDAIDGDPDEEDATDAEDDHQLTRQAVSRQSGPGCMIGDPDKAIDDDYCDGETDSEPDEEAVPAYGLDQSEPLPIDVSATVQNSRKVIAGVPDFAYIPEGGRLSVMAA